jgi:hypothetical protein
LRFKRCEPGFFENLRKVLAWRFIADLAVGLPGDETQIYDIVGLSAGMTGFE